MPIREVLVVGLLATASGCSYAFVRGPPTSLAPAVDAAADAQVASQACTRSNALPILDTVLGTVLAAGGTVVMVAGIGAAIEHKSCQGFACPTLSSGDAAAVAVLGAAAAAGGGVLLASGISGFGRTEDCRRAIETSMPTMLPPPASAAPAAAVSP